MTTRKIKKKIDFNERFQATMKTAVGEDDK